MKKKYKLYIQIDYIKQQGCISLWYNIRKTKIWRQHSFLKLISFLCLNFQRINAIFIKLILSCSNFCSETFPRNSDFENHMTEAHGVEESFHCDICTGLFLMILIEYQLLSWTKMRHWSARQAAKWYSNFQVLKTWYIA